VEWTPSIAADLSRYGCPECAGTGVPGRRRLSVCLPPEPEAAPGETTVVRLCTCVYRAVFRACYRRFLHCGRLDPSMRKISYERTPRAVDRSLVWARRNEDFRADFHASGLRVLPKHLYQLFSFYYLHGAKMAMVCRRLGISDRRAYDWMAEIETIVGREIAHLQPYSLFPPQGYMIPTSRGRRSSTHDGVRRAG
jgi:hypothetical protein